MYSVQPKHPRASLTAPKPKLPDVKGHYPLKPEKVIEVPLDQVQGQEFHLPRGGTASPSTAVS